MPPLTQAMTAWHEFYALLGTASATMVGLLFVAASVGSSFFSRNRTAGLRMFLTASVVHFGGILALCLVMLAPLQSRAALCTLVMACGIFGLSYHGLAWRDVVRDGLIAKIDREDRFWYAVLPVVAYLGEFGSGVLVPRRPDLACETLAVAMGLLLLAGIHNAWDMTVWSITRQKE